MITTNNNIYLLTEVKVNDEWIIIDEPFLYECNTKAKMLVVFDAIDGYPIVKLNKKEEESLSDKYFYHCLNCKHIISYISNIDKNYFKTQDDVILMVELYNLWERAIDKVKTNGYTINTDNDVRYLYWNQK